MTTHCFYHSADLDGHCSGAIVKLRHPDAVMHGINYGDEVHLDEIRPDDLVIMVDFCLQPFNDMLDLAAHCGDFVWIDHHKSAIDDFSRLLSSSDKEHDMSDAVDYGCVRGVLCGTPFTARLDPAFAACELAWSHFFPNKAMPEAVRLLGRYDVWDHKDPDVLPFQMGMRSVNNTAPAVFLWRELLVERDHGLAHYIIEKGRTILVYQRNIDYDDAQVLGRNVLLPNPDSFTPINCRAYNRRRANSEPFRLDTESHGRSVTAAYFQMPDGRWTVGLYGDGSIDLGRVAKVYGGGGHPGAAGFQCNKLPFKEDPHVQ